MPTKLSALLLAAALCFWRPQAFADDWHVQALMNELGSRDSGTAQFVEKKYFAVLDRPLELSGTLAYSPGYLEKLTLLPQRERTTISGDALTIETGAGKQTRRLSLPRYPALWGFVEGLRATLTGDLSTLQRFYEIELHGSRGDWELVLLPSQAQMRAVLRLVSVRGSGGRITSIEMVETNGDRSLMQITEGAS